MTTMLSPSPSWASHGRWSGKLTSRPLPIGDESVAALPHAVQCRLVAQALEVSIEILKHVATIPDGRETVIEYLQRRHASTKYIEQASTADTQCTTRSGADTLLQVLKAAPGRSISDVVVKLAVL